jgi:crotonobetainyl-CoA:carnitine CoA-transferase CaiB-like acyl-CoA transferase
MSLPLEGIKVIELGNFIAGPFCGMLLGDMGADVIKVERPKNGDQTRAMPPMINGQSASFAALNRNKQSLVLDLKQPQAIEILKKLVKESDVFLENNRPGVLPSLGLGPEI